MAPFHLFLRHLQKLVTTGSIICLVSYNHFLFDFHRIGGGADASRQVDYLLLSFGNFFFFFSFFAFIFTDEQILSYFVSKIYM